MDRNQPTAGEGADVGTSFFVEREIPSRERFAPVAKGVGESVAPVHPVRGIVGRIDIGTTLGPIEMRVRMGVADLFTMSGVPT